MAQLTGGVSGSLTFSLFQVDQSNILVNRRSAGGPRRSGGFLMTQARPRSRGVEIDADLAFESGANLWLSYAYADAIFTTTSLEADWGATIEAGDPLINSPEHQANVQFSQSFQVGGMPAQVGAGVQYTGERLGFTAFDFYLPGYTTARFFGQIAPMERLTIRLNLDNAFDEVYYTNSYADVWVEPGAPRHYHVTASYSF